MSSIRSRGPIVIDTDVFSADLVPGSRLAERYALAHHGPAGIHLVPDGCGAPVRRDTPRLGQRRGCSGWKRTIARVEVVHSGPELVAVYAQLRADCVGRRPCARPEGAHRRPLDRCHRDPPRDSSRLERRDLPRRTRPAARNARVRLNEPNPRIPDVPVWYPPPRLSRWRCSFGQTKRSRFAGPLGDGASRTRTGDLLGAIQALSQLSYSPGRRQMPRGSGTV